MFVITKEPLSRSILLQYPTIGGKRMPTMVAGTYCCVVTLFGKKFLRRLWVHEFKKYLHHDQNDDDIQNKSKHKQSQITKTNRYYTTKPCQKRQKHNYCAILRCAEYFLLKKHAHWMVFGRAQFIKLQHEHEVCNEHARMAIT